MTINLNNGLIGLSVLGGSSAYTTFQNGALGSESAAVRAAREAFTTPRIEAPWLDASGTDTATRAQVAAVRRLASIIDTTSAGATDQSNDVRTAFTTYKALENLRILADAGRSRTMPGAERSALETVFARGLADLQGYLAGAETDLLELGFRSVSSSTRSLGVATRYAGEAVIGSGVSATRAQAVTGLAGNEVFQLTLTRTSMSEMVSVDLSQAPQPPTLDSVAAALNAAIGARIATDANGDPLLDAEGNPLSQWRSSFTVEKNEGQWGLVFHPAGAERVAIDQLGAGDALIVASGETTTISGTASPNAASVYRIEDLSGAMAWERLGTINALDTEATARAAASAAATARATGTEVPEDADYTVLASGSANAILTDANGDSYIVGTTRGDIGAQLGDGDDDLFLTRINSEGQITWQRRLGAAGAATGVALSLAPNGEIVVAGTVSGAFSGGEDSQDDLLVVRFNARGEELSSTAVRQVGNETASAVTVGADGSIYVAGRSTANGGDAMIVRLDASGLVRERRMIDSGGSDSISALAIDGDGNLLALTSESGTATLRRIAAGDLSQDLGAITLGAASARAIAVSDSGQIALAGTTSGALAGNQTNSPAGGSDAFVTLVSADFSSTTTSYLGTGSAEQADSLAFLDGALYLGGRTSGTLGEARAGEVDGFVARIDPASGAVETVSQWGRRSSTLGPVRIYAASGGGTGALGALGLHRGVLNQQSSGDLVDETSLRAGDSFRIAIDGRDPRRVEIADGETMASLAEKIRRLTGSNASITTPFTDGASSLRIDVRAGHSIELIAGPNGRDALAKLGLDPIRLVPPRAIEKNETTVRPGGRFNLGLSGALTLTDPATSATALSAITSAISMIQSAYRSLYWDEGKAATFEGRMAPVTGAGSAYQQSRLASYQAALSRLSGAF